MSKPVDNRLVNPDKFIFETNPMTNKTQQYRFEENPMLAPKKEKVKEPSPTCATCIISGGRKTRRRKSKNKRKNRFTRHK